jgi:hypothetical protein
MPKFISNIPSYTESYKYGVIQVTGYHMTETRNSLPSTTIKCPGYDMDYVRSYMISTFCMQASDIPGYGEKHIANWMHEMTETEKEFDRLSIVKPGQTLTSWAINVRIPLQELWAKKRKLSVYHRECLFAGFGEGKIIGSQYYRPKIHKSCMAICFYCWKLVKINDKGGRIEASDFLKDHRNQSCTVSRTKERCARRIQKAYRDYRKRPTSYYKKVWEVVKNDNTPKEKKFLGMLDPEEKMTIYSVYRNLYLMADPSVKGCLIYNITEDYFVNQLYNQKCYSGYKRRQLCERLSQAWKKYVHMRETKVVTPNPKNTFKEELLQWRPRRQKYYHDYTNVGRLAESYFDSVRARANVGRLAESYFDSV